MLCYDVWTVVCKFVDIETFFNVLNVNQELNKLKDEAVVISKFNIKISLNINFKIVKDQSYIKFVPTKHDGTPLTKIFNSKNSKNNYNSLSIISQFKNICKLDLSKSQELTDSHLEHLNGLKMLDLSCCQNITNEGLKYLTNVETLNLSRCQGISDDGLKYLSNTKSLNLSYCKHIKGNGIRSLTNINILDISHIYCEWNPLDNISLPSKLNILYIDSRRSNELDYLKNNVKIIPK